MSLVNCKNGTEVNELCVDKKISGIFAPINSSVFENLEKDIIQFGCLSPIVIWGNTILDGHARYEICRKNNIAYSVVSLNIKNQDDAVAWVYFNQRNRRNMTPYARVESALKIKKSLKAVAERLSQFKTTGSFENYLASTASVSRSTYNSVVIIMEKASEDTKQLLRDGVRTIAEVKRELGLDNRKKAKASPETLVANIRISFTKKERRHFISLFLQDLSDHDELNILNESIDKFNELTD